MSFPIIRTFAALLVVSFVGTTWAQSPITFSTAADDILLGVTNEPHFGQLVGSPDRDVALVVSSSSSGSTIGVYDRMAPLGGGMANLVIPVANSVTALQVEDLDLDGDDDIVVAKLLGPSAGAIGVLLNSSGVFSETTYPMGAGNGRITIRDMDGNSTPDILFAGTIFYGAGNGTFVGSTVFSFASESMAADFNGDGNVDVLRIFAPVLGGGLSNASIEVYMRGPTGSYSPLPTLTQFGVVSPNLLGFGIGDFNGDAAEDLVVGIDRGLFLPDRLAIYLGSSSVSTPFVLNQTFEMIREPFFGSTSFLRNISVVDLNGDGARDCAFVYAGDPSVLVNNGAGVLGRTPDIGFGLTYRNHPNTITIFKPDDLDSDGDLDFVSFHADLMNVPLPPFRMVVCSPGPVGTPYTLQIVPRPGQSLVYGNGVSPGGDVVAGARFEAVTPFGSVPIRGHLIDTALAPNGTLANSLATFPLLMTTAVGEVFEDFMLGGVSGVPTLTFSSVVGPTTFAMPCPAGGSLVGVGGQNQSAPIGGFPFSSPVQFQLRDVFGTPIPGVQVQLTATTAPTSVVVQTPNTVVTDASGVASFNVTSGLVGAGSFLVASSPTFTSASTSLSVTNGMSIVSGNQQAASLGDAFPSPLVAAAVSIGGMPLVGVPMTFSLVSGNVTFTSPTTVLTDSLGRGSVTLATGTTIGTSTIRATSPVGIITFTVKTRGLKRVDNGLTGLVAMQYAHENTLRPFILCVDTPMATPGFVPTVFGPFYTSILTPGPSFSYLDGIGYFGPPDPTVNSGVAGTWTRTFNLGPAPLGVQVVMQVYALDFSYAYPNYVTVSNGLFTTL